MLSKRLFVIISIFFLNPRPYPFLPLVNVNHWRFYTILGQGLPVVTLFCSIGSKKSGIEAVRTLVVIFSFSIYQALQLSPLWCLIPEHLRGKCVSICPSWRRFAWMGPELAQNPYWHDACGYCLDVMTLFARLGQNHLELVLSERRSPPFPTFMRPRHFLLSELKYQGVREKIE